MRTQHYRIRSGDDLGRVLRDARTAHGLTQQQMVDRFELGFDRTRLARIEAGEGFQSLDRALSVLRRLGIDVSAMVPEPAQANAPERTHLDELADAVGDEGQHDGRNDHDHDDDRHRDDGGASSWQ
jgi:transcriptional regulator with XRE-family HTH domain